MQCSSVENVDVLQMAGNHTAMMLAHSTNQRLLRQLTHGPQPALRQLGQGSHIALSINACLPHRPGRHADDGGRHRRQLEIGPFQHLLQPVDDGGPLLDVEYTPMFSATVCAPRMGGSYCHTVDYRHRLVKRWGSLVRGRSPGRPARLPPTQRPRLKELVVTGPDACGTETGCWNSALIQDLIWRAFGTRSNVHYLSTLLKNPGLSYPKARVGSDHHDPDKRKEWCEVTWPAR